MNEQLLVSIAGQPDLTLPLKGGRLRIGSNPQCELPIDHPEVAALALMLEYRGGAFFVQNLNSYDIYVDNETLHAQSSSLWSVGQDLYLTQSVTLRLQGGPSPNVEGGAAQTGAKSTSVDKKGTSTTETKPASNRAFYQITTIVLCALIAFYALSTDSSRSGPTIASFDSLCAGFPENSKITREQRNLRNYLQDAWLIDIRAGNYSPDVAINAYTLVLEHPLIANAVAGNDNLPGQIKAFAASRILRYERMRGK